MPIDLSIPFKTLLTLPAFFLVTIMTNQLLGDVTTIVDDNLLWQTRTYELACEELADFGVDPIAQDNVAGITRSGTGSLGTSFVYGVNNRDTLAEINNADLIAAAGPMLSGYYHDTNATLDVETPVSQGGTTSANWGIDSSGSGNNNSIGGIESRNAAVFSFKQQVTAFSVDLLDFEASTGQEGLLVLARGGTVIHTEDIAFGDTGNGETHNFGILTSVSDAFDQVMFVLGDFSDTSPDNGYGGSEFWATSNVKMGFASVPEPTATTGLLFLLGFLGLRRSR